MHSEIVLGEGAFDSWPADLLGEFRDRSGSEMVGQRIAFEDGRIRVWSIELDPGERLPFHRHRHDYTWTCLTSGTGLTRYDTGEMFRVSYQRGDQAFYDHRAKGDFVHDLENTGQARLSFVTVEYLD